MTEEQLAEALADTEVTRIREAIRAGNPLQTSVTISGQTFDYDGDGSFDERIDAIRHVVKMTYLRTIQRLRLLGYIIVSRQ